MTTQRVKNLKRFKRAPTHKMMRAFIKKCGLSVVAFEDAFGLPRDTVRKALSGDRQLAVKYWHIFYEGNLPDVIEVYSRPNKGENRTNPRTKEVASNLTDFITPQNLVRGTIEDIYQNSEPIDKIYKAEPEPKVMTDSSGITIGYNPHPIDKIDDEPKMIDITYKPPTPESFDGGVQKKEEEPPTGHPSLGDLV